MASKTLPKIGLHTFAELEASLRELSAVFASGPEPRRACRDAAIAAKERARFASRNAKASDLKRRVKAEMAEWLLVWLGDPSLFEEWARLRRAHMPSELLSGESGGSPENENFKPLL